MVAIKPVHKDRYSNSAVVARKKGVVIHTSEGPENPGSTDQLIYFMSLPGDRVIEGSDPPRRYGASYHAVADGNTGEFAQVLPATAGPYSAPPFNKTWWHICCPGKAGQTADQWRDEFSRLQVRAVAKFIVAKSAEDGFPIARRSPEQLVAGLGGFCGHVDVSNAFHQSNHTDPGKEFPWDLLAHEITSLIYPPALEDPVRALTEPYRLYDSRTVNKPLKAGEVREVAVMAVDVVVNITVISPAKDGYLVAWGPGAMPGTSNVNFEKGRTVANLARIATDNGIIRVKSTADCHVAIDVQAAG